MTRVLSESELHRQTADSLEYLYREGRVSRADVIRWVRLSAKMSGRIYQPIFRSSPKFRDHYMSLRRREDLEDRLFKKRGGYYKRDAHRPPPLPPKDVSRMANILRRHGYTNAHARAVKMHHQGIGPHELLFRVEAGEPVRDKKRRRSRRRRSNRKGR